MSFQYMGLINKNECINLKTMDKTKIIFLILFFLIWTYCGLTNSFDKKKYIWTYSGLTNSFDKKQKERKTAMFHLFEIFVT